jgi:hypothetical protein
MAMAESVENQWLINNIAKIISNNGYRSINAHINK